MILNSRECAPRPPAGEDAPRVFRTLATVMLPAGSGLPPFPRKAYPTDVLPQQ
jgi:hypothetical protein